MTKIISFPSPKSSAPTRGDIVKYLNNLGADLLDFLLWDSSLNVKWKEDGLDIMQVIEVIKEKNVVDGPRLDKHGDWVVELEKKWVGRRKIRVTIAIGKNYLDVIKVT